MQKAELNRKIQLLEQQLKDYQHQVRKLTWQVKVFERRKASLVDFEYPVDVFLEVMQHSPYSFYLLQWVPYQTEAKRWRLKMQHDVRTFDGREAYGIWPNGNSCGPFSDDEVEFIRISKDQFDFEWVDLRDSVETKPEFKLELTMEPGRNDNQ